MERPGLLEFVVYALVLTVAASWVYALPPFTHEPGSGLRSAETDLRAVVSSGPVESSGNEQSGAIADVSNRNDAAADTTSVAEAQTAAVADTDAQPRLNSRPNLLVVTATSLNMRSEPNAASALVGSYPRGALVERMDISGNWVLVRTLDDDTTGWMYASYLGAADGD